MDFNAVKTAGVDFYILSILQSSTSLNYNVTHVICSLILLYFNSPTYLILANTWMCATNIMHLDVKGGDVWLFKNVAFIYFQTQLIIILV